ncbi:hypothetical protein F4818DRAFT_340654 [Hypoxylon cercidicola]|nr:hypothetical protein F4818DRAFT_340654 [Hypoxylon cercidicola]
MFVTALKFHRKGIDLMEQLLETHDTAVSEDIPYRRHANMKEGLADILLKCNSDNDQEAKEVLQRLLKREVDRAAQMDKDRRTRLCTTSSVTYTSDKASLNKRADSHTGP